MKMSQRIGEEIWANFLDCTGVSVKVELNVATQTYQCFVRVRTSLLTYDEVCAAIGKMEATVSQGYVVINFARRLRVDYQALQEEKRVRQCEFRTFDP